jgi:hypothetical protein
MGSHAATTKFQYIAFSLTSTNRRPRSAREHEDREHDGVEPVRQEVRRVQAEQEPHRGAVGVGVPAHVEHHELERAHEQEHERERDADDHAHAHGVKVAPLRRLLGEVVGNEAQRAGRAC